LKRRLHRSDGVSNGTGDKLKKKIANKRKPKRGKQKRGRKGGKNVFRSRKKNNQKSKNWVLIKKGKKGER